MKLHESTFQYLKPTDDQVAHMGEVRARFEDFTQYLNQALADGPDKTYVIRKLREVAMWANITITREADGSPRS